MALLKLDNPEFLPYAIDLGKTDPDVVSVDDFGYITAVGAGTTEVTYKTLDGITGALILSASFPVISSSGTCIWVEA